MAVLQPQPHPQAPQQVPQQPRYYPQPPPPLPKQPRSNNYLHYTPPEQLLNARDSGRPQIVVRIREVDRRGGSMSGNRGCLAGGCGGRRGSMLLGGSSAGGGQGGGSSGQTAPLAIRKIITIVEMSRLLVAGVDIKAF